jgi:hypothetical protein
MVTGEPMPPLAPLVKPLKSPLRHWSVGTLPEGVDELGVRTLCSLTKKKVLFLPL